MQKISQGLDAVAGGVCSCAHLSFMGVIHNYGVITNLLVDSDGKPYFSIETDLPVVISKPEK